MSIDKKSGARTDGGFTITNTSAVVNEHTKYQTDRGAAKIYFGSSVMADISNPTDVGPLYPVLNTDLSIGIFMKNWVIQQSDSLGKFPTNNSILNNDILWRSCRFRYI